MKILWLTALQLPTSDPVCGVALAPSGGWVGAMLSALCRRSEVSSVHVVGIHKGKTVRTASEGKLIQTSVPSSSGRFRHDPHLAERLRAIIDDYRPDVIDVQGVEFYLAKSLLSLSLDIPAVATIQGLVSECTRHYNAGIPAADIVRSLTIRNLLQPSGLFSGRRQYWRRGRNEVASLKQFRHVLGRTEWDKAHVRAHNPTVRYYHCDRILRPAFYERRWQLNDVDRYSVFTTQARYPLKGLHVLLRAVHLLKPEFPGIKLYVGGKHLLNRRGLFAKVSFSDYQNYIRGLIDRLDLDEEVAFTGVLNDDEVADRLCRSHVFVIPSFIDNSPNALAEAQVVGTPAVASYVGGIPTYVRDGETGLLYNCDEPVMLAEKLRRVLNDDGFAARLSDAGRVVALTRHDRARNCGALLDAYQSIIDHHGAS